MADEPRMLNLDQFDSPSAAKGAIAAERVFDEEALAAFQGVSGLTILVLFVMSAVVRARGLYEAIVREIGHDNPHAVFPLMRQFAETVAMAFYVADHPHYAQALTTREKDKPEGAPRRRSVQALINHVEKHYAQQFGAVYAKLSEGTHFGTVAMWTAHRVEGGTSPATRPRRPVSQGRFHGRAFRGGDTTASSTSRVHKYSNFEKRCRVQFHDLGRL